MGSEFDIVETAIGWVANAGPDSVDPDCVAFRFFGGGNGSTTVSNNLQSANDLDSLLTSFIFKKKDCLFGQSF